MGNVWRASTTAMQHVYTVILYRNEARPINAEDFHGLYHNEMVMIPWMSGATLRDKYSCEEHRAWVSMKSIVDVRRLNKV